MSEREGVFSALLKKFPTDQDREQLLEAFSIITDRVSRQIIAKAASPHTPFAINEFMDISESAMVRYLHLLGHVDVLEPVWDRGVRKFGITKFGKEIASVIAHQA
jgi:hypothetical protein